MNREDYKLLPLAALGIAKGIGEVVLKPLALSLVAKVIPSQEEIDAHIVAASIQYHSTGELRDDSASANRG